MRFHFSLWWFLFAGLAMISHALKNYVLIFIMLAIHEGGHILAAKACHLQVEKVDVYPFGLSAQIDHLDHTTPYVMIIVMLAGLCTHLIFPFIIVFFYHNGMISISYRDYLLQVNRAILLFNLLPMYPMDGGRLFFSFMRFFFSYAISRKITLFLSLLIILVLLVVSVVSMKIILIFLFVLVVYEYRRNDLDQVEFYYSQRNHFKLDQNHV